MNKEKKELHERFEELERNKPTSYKQQVLANGTINLSGFNTIHLDKLLDKLRLHDGKRLGESKCNVTQKISLKDINNDPLK